MSRSERAEAERAVQKRYRSRGDGERWTVDLSAEDAALVVEWAERMGVEPAAALVGAAVQTIRMADKVDTFDPSDSIASLLREVLLRQRPPPARHPFQPEVVDGRRLSSNLSLGVVRVVSTKDGPRYQAARGLGGQTVQLSGTWPTWQEATASAIREINRARHVRGVYDRLVVPFRYPDRHGVERAHDAPDEPVDALALFDFLDARATIGTTARERREERRGRKKT